MPDSVEEIAKITNKLGDHEFRITKLEKQMEQATNNIHELTNSVKALTKIVREDHKKLNEVKEDIKDLKDAYKRYADENQKNFNKLLDVLSKKLNESDERVKREENFKNKLIIELLKTVILLSLAVAVVKLANFVFGGGI